MSHRCTQGLKAPFCLLSSRSYQHRLRNNLFQLRTWSDFYLLSCKKKISSFVLGLPHCQATEIIFWSLAWNIFWFSIIIGNFIIPTDELIFFQSGRYPTNQEIILEPDSSAHGTWEMPRTLLRSMPCKGAVLSCTPCSSFGLQIALRDLAGRFDKAHLLCT